MALPLLGAGIIGLGNLIGNWISGASQAAAQDRANAANAQMAHENRLFQAEMSNTAHQRAVRDLRMSGLNPILAANNGSSTPSGSTANIEASNPLSGVGAGVSGGIATALDAASTIADVEAKGSASALADAQKATEAAKAIQTANSAKESAARTEQIKAELPGKVAQSQFNKEQSEIDRENIVYDNIMKRASQAVGVGSSAVDMINPLKGLLKGKQKDAFDKLRDTWKGKQLP